MPFASAIYTCRNAGRKAADEDKLQVIAEEDESEGMRQWASAGACGTIQGRWRVSSS